MRVALASVVVDAAGVEAAVRLTRSLRWFGGSLAAAPITFVALEATHGAGTAGAAATDPAEGAPTRDGEPAGEDDCGVAMAGDRGFAAAGDRGLAGAGDRGLAAALDEAGVGEGVVVHVATGDGRAAMAEAVSALDTDLVLLLGSDSLVLRDPSPELVAGRLQALPSEALVVSDDQRRRLAALCGVADHAFRDCEAPIAVGPPRAVAALLTRWLAYAQTIVGRLDILGEHARWCDALAFSLAVAAERGDLALAPELALPAHAPLTHRFDPTIDAAIVRAAIADAPERIAFTPYPFVQARIERLNRRLAGHERPPSARSAPDDRSPAQVLVLGMHRSGTSMLAGLLASAGLHVGTADDFPPADAHNPKGYFELLDVWAIDEVLLRLLDATWDAPGDVDCARLRPRDRDLLRARARLVVERLDREGPWVVKDPRLSVLLPFWRPFLTRPVAVLVYRDPHAVARSLASRDGMALERGLALWERYNRAALAVSAGMPRLVVAQRDLLADAPATMARVVADLGRAGVAGLAVPSDEALASAIAPELVHHRPGDPSDVGPLAASAAALLAELERARLA